MKKIIFASFLCSLMATASAQAPTSSLLWRITGKKLSRPSYLFGTIHMLCADDIVLSDSLKSAIAQSDKVYLELDMDNIFEMVGVMGKMKMRNDTTLADLLTPAEYEKVKTYFEEKSSMIPFSMLEKFKPMLAASTLMESAMECDNPISMEQLIMQESKRKGKGIKGLESMSYQVSIFDSIPYKLQARQLLEYVENAGKDSANADFDNLVKAYRNQELDKLEELAMKDDVGMANFAALLLYNRNANWIKKMDELMPGNSLVVAVGAGHLPGANGVINLLRKAGYKVEPVENKMIRKAKTNEL